MASAMAPIPGVQSRASLKPTYAIPSHLAHHSDSRRTKPGLIEAGIAPDTDTRKPRADSRRTKPGLIEAGIAPDTDARKPRADSRRTKPGLIEA